MEWSTQDVAVGVLMANTPCTAAAAEDVLAAAAYGADVSVAEMARAVVDRSHGLPLPSGVERALRVAIEGVRTPTAQV
ncbi:hypothetical protein ACWFR1_32315 [Streptomyces sp. NPDC055103]